MARQLWEHKVKKPKDVTSREKSMAKSVGAKTPKTGVVRKAASKTKKGMC